LRHASLVLLVAVLGLSGCGSGKHRERARQPRSAEREVACTLIGCSSGVGVGIEKLPKELPRARKIDVCVAGECTHGTVYEIAKPEGKYVPKAYPAVFDEPSGLRGPGPYPVSVTVYDRQGAVLLRVSDSVVMEKDYPNGVSCPPPCFIASLRLNVGSRMLERLPPGLLAAGEHKR